MVGSDILIYRLVYNLVENAIKYNRPGGQVICDSGVEKKTCFSFRRRVQEAEFQEGTQKTGI